VNEIERSPRFRRNLLAGGLRSLGHWKPPQIDDLQRHGLKPITESGVRFDPNIHEAVVREEDPSVPSHTVVAVLQKGYFLHDRLLRPAMVKVAVGGPEEYGENGENGSAGA